MTYNIQTKIDTKKKALKLIYDQAYLLSLLYSKYGDIDEDYNILIINQLIYDCSSHLNIIFKEYQFLENYDEYLKRWYKYQESSNRIPKLSDYYKNYHKFFCRPNFNDFAISNLMHNYGDDKAELFYKNNFDFSNSEIDESEKNNSSLSSIDNITNNRTIFTNKNKFIIEGNEQSINYSMTLTLNNTTIKNIQNNKKNLISARSIKNSFEEMVHNLVYFQKKINIKKSKKNKKDKNNNFNVNKKEKIIKKDNEKYIPKKNIIYTINDLDKNKINNNKKNNKDKKSPKQLTIISKPHIINNNNNHKINGIINNNYILNAIFKNINSPKNIIKSRHSHKTKLEEYNNNYIKRNNNNFHQRNKTYNLTQNYSLNNHSGDNIKISLKGLIKNTSQNRVKSNNILTFKDIANKHTSKKKKKNITFENNIYTQINQISSMPFLKYKMTTPSNKKIINNQYKSNKNIIKNNNFIGSKFNLVKNLKNSNNIDRNKGKKHTSYNYYQNILTQILPDNKNSKKSKNITSIGLNTNTTNSSKINKSISPINANKNDKLSSNVNEIKNRNKNSKNQINNFNINFNNVFFTSSKPTSYIIDNNKNINNSNAYSSISINKNFNNNSLNNNYVNSNILEQENKTNKNLYVMNLKNIYNFSRNKNNIFNNPLTQIEGNHPKTQNNYNIIHIKNNNNKAKTIFEKNITHTNFNYHYGDEENNLNNKIQNPIIINKNINENQKMQSNNIINYIRKAHSNFIMRNQNRNNLELPKNINVIYTENDMTKKNLKNNKSFNCSKNICSSSVSRRKNKNKINNNICNKGQNIYGKKRSSLTSQKNIKSKYKRKIKNNS